MPPSNFTVTGHSLGGFLAAGMVAEPVFADHISHAYLFNAPGVGGFTGSHAAAYAVLNFLGISSLYDQSKISNIKAATGISPISGLGFDAAPLIDIIIEDQMASDISDPPGARNHSQQVLTTDSFSRLYRLFPIGAEPGAGATQQTDGCFRFDQGCQWSIQ